MLLPLNAHSESFRTWAGLAGTIWKETFAPHTLRAVLFCLRIWKDLRTHTAGPVIFRFDLEDLALPQSMGPAIVFLDLEGPAHTCGPFDFVPDLEKPLAPSPPHTHQWCC
jgi:hypothetical protein